MAANAGETKVKLWEGICYPENMRDEWPSGWVNVGEIVEGKLPKAAPETVTLSLKVPAAMKRALEKEAKAEGKSTGAYARGILADDLMAIA